MNVMWSRLPREVRDRIDVHLRRRHLIPAIMMLRTEGGLDPVPGLHEAQEVLVERYNWLAQQGMLGLRPQVEVAQVIAVVQSIAAPVVAIEAVWDGDTEGWMVDLVAVVRRPSQYHRDYDEVHLGTIRRGGDIRLFNGQVPPWPEATEAAQIGEVAAAYLGVPFHFTDPNHPDVGLARWWDRDRVSPNPIRQYHYVGPEDISAAAIGTSGWRITSGDDLEERLAGLPIQDRRQPQTFIVDTAGTLRLAARRSEHVACAGGGPVLSAGEIAFAGLERGWRVGDVTNQSTGFCPEVSSWSAVAAACERAGLAHPGRFTDAFEFRRCIDCDQINIVKDSDFTCAACGADLPTEWNVTR